MKNILVIGSMNMDMVVRVNRLPVPGETVLAGQIDKTPGGKGANQAYAATLLGGKVTILGKVGCDRYGEALLANLAGAGVCISNVESIPGKETGLAIVCVNDAGENSIVVVPGANACVDRAYIMRNAECMKNADIVVLQMEIPMETVIFAARMAREMNKQVILDPAPARGPLPDALLQYVDIIKPNTVELALLTRTQPGDDPEKSVAELFEKGVSNVILSMGESGALLFDSNGTKTAFPAYPVHAVDTTGAGDCFIAAIAVSLANGNNLQQAISTATVASAISVTRMGAQASMPNISDVTAFRERITAQGGSMQ